MMRSSVTYRRFLYFRSRNSVKINIYFKLIITFVIVGLAISYIHNRIFPHILDMTENEVRTEIIAIVNDLAGSELTKESYSDNYILIDRDQMNNIKSIQVNTIALNKLCYSISQQINSELVINRKSSTAVPFGVLFGNTIFSGLGPDINIRYYLAGNVETSFISEFTESGINQTLHRIVLQVKIRIGLAVPLIKEKSDILVNIPVAETVIVGSVPGT